MVSSLELPHGDPAPTRPRKGEAWVKTFGPREDAEPTIVERGGKGFYSALGYRAARVAEREGRAPSRAGAVQHERIDRLKLQFQSREFVRNNGLYKGMIRRARSYIVGQGFELTCNTGSRRLNRKIEKAFRAWWKHPDAKGELSGRRMEAMVVDELLTTGDLGVIPIEKKTEDKLQLVEAEQIIGRYWLHQGIDRDKTGTPIRFWVSPYHPEAGYPQIDKSVAYTPETFFYIGAPDRPSSIRATPPLQSSFPMVHRINDLADAEAIARQIQSRIALIINKEIGPAVAGGVGTTTNQNRQPIDGDPTNNYLTQLDVALVAHAKPGETITGMDRTAPGAGFSETLQIFLRLLGLPLGMPLELILLDWTGSNYSQSKAVLEQAFQAFLDWQELLVDLFYTKVFEWWLRRRVAAGEFEDREDILEHSWTGPTFPWIDALTEAQAQGEKMKRGFTTHARVCRSLNEDREQILPELVEEAVEAIEASNEVFERTGVRIPWERFAGLEPATAANQAKKPEDEKKAGEKDEKPAEDKATPPSAPKQPKKKPAGRIRHPLPRSFARELVTT